VKAPRSPHLRSGARQIKELARRTLGKLESPRHPRNPLADLRSLTDISNLVTLYAVRVVVTLGVIDLIDDGTKEVAELAQKSGAHVDALARVLRHLVATGILTQEGAGRIGLSDIGTLLLKDHPSLCNDVYQLGSVSPRFEACIEDLLHSVLTGEPSYAKANGAPFWEQLAAEPQLARSFDIDMQQHVGSIGVDLAEAIDWIPVSNVVDVGGGTGALLSHLLSAHPHLRGTLVEYADAATRASAMLKTSGLGDRVIVQEGSFFEVLPAGKDVYILSWILHDWPDEQVIAILTRCQEASGPTGRVLVIERPVDPARLSASTSGDLRMMAFVGGRERSLPQYRDLFAAANLQIDETTRLHGGFVAMDASSSRRAAAARSSRLRPRNQGHDSQVA
jgi:2,7-dihydroxy-5-methyl-1-naphthoate 7-O-methyltransferase